MGNDTKWLAVCANGAIALGAYEAGVISQIYADVAEANATRGNAVQVDAIAGASAGSVTGLLLAQAIVTGESPDSLTARMRRVWIDDLNLIGLLGDTDNKANSIFDPKCVENVRDTELLKDAEIEAAAKQKRTDPVSLWINLTNVDGIPYEVELDGGVKVVASMYADYEPLVIEGGVPHRAPSITTLKAGPMLQETVPWREVAQAALTSGSFPFAFKSRVIERNLEHYPDTMALKQIAPEMPTKAKFNYIDGGVLNNNPLGRAIDAASFQEALYDHDESNRFYIILDPDPSEPVKAIKELEQAQDGLADGAGGMPPMALASAVVETYFNDAVYRDLAKAQGINRQIDRLTPLWNRLEKLDSGLLKEIQEATGFDYKKRICIERVPYSPRDGTLAGAFMGHFGGFFAKAYREHDFALGCEEARKWFADWAARNAVPVPSGDLQASPTPLPKPSGLKGVPAAGKAKLKELIVARVEALLKENVRLGCAPISGVVMFALKGLLRGQLDRKFEEEA